MAEWKNAEEMLKFVLQAPSIFQDRLARLEDAIATKTEKGSRNEGIIKNLNDAILELRELKAEQAAEREKLQESRPQLVENYKLKSRIELLVEKLWEADRRSTSEMFGASGVSSLHGLDPLESEACRMEESMAFLEAIFRNARYHQVVWERIEAKFATKTNLEESDLKWLHADLEYDLKITKSQLNLEREQLPKVAELNAKLKYRIKHLVRAVEAANLQVNGELRTILRMHDQ